MELGAAASLVASELGDEQAALARLVKRECDAVDERAAILQRDAVTHWCGCRAGQACRGKWLVNSRGRRPTDQVCHGRPTWNNRSVPSAQDYDTSPGTAGGAGAMDRCNQAQGAQSSQGSTPEVSAGARSLGLVQVRIARRAQGRCCCCARSGYRRRSRDVFAKLAGRAVPGVGWWLVGVDALQGLSQGAREELAARRLSQEAWAADQRGTCLRFISGAEASIRSVLKKADRSMQATVEDHRKAASRLSMRP